MHARYEILARKALDDWRRRSELGTARAPQSLFVAVGKSASPSFELGLFRHLDNGRRSTITSFPEATLTIWACWEPSKNRPQASTSLLAKIRSRKPLGMQLTKVRTSRDPQQRRMESDNDLIPFLASHS